MRRTSLSLAPALGIAVSAIPCLALDFAEVELVASSISRAGAPANFGFPSNSPELVIDDDSETPLGMHGDHEDVLFLRDRLYGADERVNASRSSGSNGAARGTIEAGHSLSVSTGYADAGSNELGGRAEAHAGFLGPSEAGAGSTMRIEKRITILAGASGLADGTLVTGLRWVLDGHGTLEVGGRSYPNDSAASAGSGLHVLMLRGPTGRCGAFDCPTGALAVQTSFSTGLSVTDRDPNLSGGHTAQVTRHDSWSASNNTGDLKAGDVFASGSETVEVGAPVTQEDVEVGRVESVDTGGAPLGLDAIEFEANVGETLRVEMSLDVSAGVDGWGHGESDFFGSFDGHVEDPQGRGLVFQSSVPVPEPGAAGAVSVLFLALRRFRRGSRERRRRGRGAGARPPLRSGVAELCADA
jgi:hypothetical protein